MKGDLQRSLLLSIIILAVVALLAIIILMKAGNVDALKLFPI
jgi:hypothetical protein